MRYGLMAALVAFGVAASVAAVAAPRLKPGREKTDGAAVVKGGAVPVPIAAGPVCGARRNVLVNEERREEALQSEVAGADAQIVQLKTLLDQAKRRRDDAARDLASVQTRIKKIRDVYKKECEASEDCPAYESQAQAVNAQTESLERDLEAVRQEIKTNREAITRLEQQISPLQREYSEKKCNNLVPGETEQSVIDRCTAIFSDWNRLQAELNRLNNRVPDLKSQFEQLLTQLKALEAKANSYEVYLAKNCSGSPMAAAMKDFGKRRERAQTIGQELDSLISDITRVRSVRITISTN